MFEEDLKKAVLRALDNGKARGISTATGVTESSLSRWKHGRRFNPQLDVIAPMIDYLELELRPKTDDTVDVPYKEAVAGAGSSHLTDGDIRGYFRFQSGFFNSLRVSSDKCFLMSVMGDSMKPTLNNGDTILVDQSATQSIVDGCIYLIGFEEDLLVKRVCRTPCGLELISDNELFPPVKVQGDERDKLQIYGRVVWVGKAI